MASTPVRVALIGELHDDRQHIRLCASYRGGPWASVCIPVAATPQRHAWRVRRALRYLLTVVAELRRDDSFGEPLGKVRV